MGESRYSTPLTWGLEWVWSEDGTLQRAINGILAIGELNQMIDWISLYLAREGFSVSFEIGS